MATGDIATMKVPETEGPAPDVEFQQHNMERMEVARSLAENFEARAREQRRVERAAQAALGVLEESLGEELEFKQKDKVTQTTG